MLFNALLLCAAALAEAAAPTGLLADFQKSPSLGVRLAPRFSWIVPPCPSAPDQAQTSYQVKVYGDTGSLEWDSGLVADSDSTYVLYAGPPLAASSAYTWTVATTSGSSCTSEPSAPASFVTALPASGFAPAAHFITTNGSATFGYFRAVIALPAALSSAVLHVAAENEDKLLCGYKLYVNGALVNVGPGRGEAPVWGGDGTFHAMPIQTLDVTAALGSGPTAVLALVGMHSGSPAVIAQLTLHTASGASTTLATDSSWAAFNADPHRGPTPGSGSAGVGFIEHIDARQEPVGWRSAGFVPDARWGPAVATPPTADQAAALAPGMKPPMQVLEGMQLQSLVPAPPQPPGPPSSPVTCGVVGENAVLLLGGCPGGALIAGITFASWGTPTGYCPNHLQRNASCDSPTAPALIAAACVGKASCSVKADRSVLGDPCLNVVKSLAVQNSTVSYVATFEREFQGGLVLDVVNGTAGATVSIACGESLDGFTVGYTWGWEFVWTLREDVQRLEQHKYMECRFVSLTFSTPVQFTLSAWAVHYPWAEEDSSFSSSNSTLDAVYNLCRYTLHGAALDTYTDSNTRERCPYEADGIIAASSRLLVQRDVLWPRHSHSFVLQVPTWPVEWKQTSALLGWQDFMSTGQPDLALAYEATMLERTFASFLDATGVLATENMGQHIVDWMPDGSESDQTVARGEFTASAHMSVSNAFAAQGLHLLATMLAAGGRNGNASAIAAQAAALTAGIQARMWNGSNFCDGICSEVGGNSRVMSNMFFLALGLVPAAGVADAWGVVADWGLQQMGDYGAFYYQLALAGSYYTGAPPYDTPDDGTAMVTALAKCDQSSWCSGLLEDNLTMTRESWHDGTYSHGWGSSAIVGVSLGVMGVHQTAPGWAAFTVKPKLGPLTHANITVPTLRGYINVTVPAAAAGAGEVHVQVPCSCRATLCSPRSALDGSSLRTALTHTLLLDGQPVPFTAAAGHLCTAEPVGCGAGGAHRIVRAQPK